MTIDFTVLTKGSETEVENIIQETFKEVDDYYNKWNPVSEISRFNQHLSVEPLPLSPMLYKLIKIADEVVQLTDGRFDPTIEPIQKLWKAALEKGEEPDEKQIELLTPFIGWDKIQFNEEMISKTHPLVELDLGGIAKGYAVDLIFERLDQAGFSPLYVEWGGEIRVSKENLSHRPWQIGIFDPRENTPIEVISLSNQAVATSGDYEQFWTIKSQGKKTVYFHVMDPKTLKPLKMNPRRISSVTVIAPSCTLADGIAKTGLFFQTENDAKIWADHLKRPELTFYFVEKEEMHD